jgi:MFS family permease
VPSASYRWVILAVGTAAQATFAAVSVGLPALAPALRSHYRLSLGEVGVVLAAVGIGMLATLLPWGLAADRIGERAVIVVGLSLAGATLVGTGWANDYASVTVLLIAAGVFGASVNAASGRAVMGWFGAEERGLALGIRQTAIPIGGATAAAVLPWLADAGGVRVAFVAMGIACLAGAAVAGIWMREPPAPPAEHREHVHAPAPLRDRRMWLLTTGSSLYCATQTALMSYVVLFLHQHRGLTPGEAAGVLAGTNALAGVTRIAVGRWSDRLHSRLLPLRLIGLGLAVWTAIAAVADDAPLGLTIAAFVVATLFGMSWNGLSFTAAAEAAGRDRAGAALGIQQTGLGVVAAFVPIAFAATVDATSWRTAFAISAVAPVLGLLALRGVSETSPGSARSRGTSAIPQAARGTPD